MKIKKVGSNQMLVTAETPNELKLLENMESGEWGDYNLGITYGYACESDYLAPDPHRDGDGLVRRIAIDEQSKRKDAFTIEPDRRE